MMYWYGSEPQFRWGGRRGVDARGRERILTEAARVARTAAPGEEPAVTTEVSGHSIALEVIASVPGDTLTCFTSGLDWSARLCTVP